MENIYSQTYEEYDRNRRLHIPISKPPEIGVTDGTCDQYWDDEGKAILSNLMKEEIRKREVSEALYNEKFSKNKWAYFSTVNHLYN
jgi:hypothetical protein